jgi:hypothetical protein
MAPKRKPFESLSKSAKYFRTHPKANANKDRISKEVNARPEQIKKRSKLSTILKRNKRNGTHQPGKDLSHQGGKIVYRDMKANRGDEGTNKADTKGDRNARGGGPKPRRKK